MKTKLIVVVAGMALAPLVAAAPPHTYILGGIDVNAVDWPTLCPSVAPVEWTRAGVKCKTVHPTSDLLRTFVDYGGTHPEPPAPDCELEASFYKRATTKQENAASPWNNCSQAFAKAIRLRSAGRVKYDDMQYQTWRDKYFAPWVVTKKGDSK